MNTINDRLRVVNIAPSKTPKTLRYGHVRDMISLVRCCTGLDLERGYSSLQRRVPDTFLILLELEFRKTQRTEDLATHQSLRIDRPYLRLVTRSSAGWIVTSEVLIRIRSDGLLGEESQSEN